MSNHHPLRTRAGSLLLLAVLTLVAAPPIQAQVSRTTPYNIADTSAVPTTAFGAVYVAVQDVNGNGSDDLAIGLPSSSGAAPGGGGVEVRDGATGTVVWRHDNPVASEAYGVFVARIDDVDGDLLDDVAVTRSMSSILSGLPIEMVDIRSSATGAQITSVPAPAQLAFFAFPHAVANVRDFNNDGLRDLAVTSATGGFGLSTRIDIIDPMSGASLTSTVFATNFGAAVPEPPAILAGRDVTGDGIEDLIIGRPHVTSNTFTFIQAGQVVALDGQNLTLVWQTFGIQANDLLGSSLAWIRDINGDGAPELAVGAPHQITAFPGRVQFHCGATGVLVGTVQPTATENVARFGQSVANVTVPLIRGQASGTETLLVGCGPAIGFFPAQPTVGFEISVSLQPAITTRILSNQPDAILGVARRLGDTNGDARDDAGLGVLRSFPTPGNQIEILRSRAAAPFGAGNPLVHTLSLIPLGATSVFGVIATGATAGNDGLLIAGLAQAGQPLLGGTLLVDASPGTGGLFALHYNPTGSAAVNLSPLAFQPELRGYSAYFQAVEVNPAAPFGIFLSDGLQVTF